SLGCAAAPDLGTLLAARFVQGAGAALLMPSSLAILGATFAGPAKGRAIGIWAASGAAMGAVGPVLGGWLIDLGSWRAVFLISLPLAGGAILLALRSVPPDPTRNAGGLDWPGAALATIGLGALTWALTEGAGPSGWTARPAGLAALAVAALAGFVLHEARRGDRAMMPLALFASRRFVGLTLLTLLLYGALGALFVLLPYVLIETAGYAATAAGAALLPLPLVLSLASPAMGALAARHGPRLPLTFGALIVAAGFLLAQRIGPGASYWTEVLPAILVIAIGLSGAVAPLTNAVLDSVDERHAGAAAGFNSAVARTGGLVATALLGSVLAKQGAALLAAFHGAMLVASVCCVIAAACAYGFVTGAAPRVPPRAG
ncbi:MAG TPA: MFS transporter, partial [Crenalkalicoccus sp.]|nr:MFS transporter [Crenalkalicoccus sp.]